MGTTEEFGTEECALLVVADEEKVNGVRPAIGRLFFRWRLLHRVDVETSRAARLDLFHLCTCFCIPRLELDPSSDRCYTSTLQDSAFSSAQLKQSEVVHAIHHISEPIAFGGLEPR